MLYISLKLYWCIRIHLKKWTEIHLESLLLRSEPGSFEFPTRDSSLGFLNCKKKVEKIMPHFQNQIVSNGMVIEFKLFQSRFKIRNVQDIGQISANNTKPSY